LLQKISLIHVVAKDLASKFGIEGFPTLKIVKGGDLENPIAYTGPRTAEGAADRIVSLANTVNLLFLFLGIVF
jgi:hypothetical protein